MLVTLAGALLIGSSGLQRTLNHDREALGLTRLPALENAPPVLASAEALWEVFYNLAANSLDAMSGEGRIDAQTGFVRMAGASQAINGNPRALMLLFLLPLMVPPITYGIPLATVLYKQNRSPEAIAELEGAGFEVVDLGVNVWFRQGGYLFLARNAKETEIVCGLVTFLNV